LNLLAVIYGMVLNLLAVKYGRGLNPPLLPHNQFTPGTDSDTMTAIMKHGPFFLLCRWLLVILLLPVINGSAAAEKKTNRMTLAATIFPIADITRCIGGPDIRVVQILPPGASPHTFDLTPGQVRELQDAQFIFKIGGMDDWIDNIADSLPQAAVISLHKYVTLRPTAEKGHDHGPATVCLHAEFDPHYWLNAANGAVIAKKIASVLAEADPARATTYKANLAEYSKQLATLHQEIKKDLSGLKNNRMIVFHDAWSYFTAAYGLEIVAVFQTSPGREPRPRDIQKLYSQVKRFGIKTVFSEPQLSISSLEPMLEDLGLELIVLDPLGGTVANDSYARMLRRNAQAILDALGR
jgi:zinc transport system substrate-binding protein